VIQVRPGPDANSSVVEMRSRSRHGRSDFGANYNRIREFFGMLKPAGNFGAAVATENPRPADGVR